MANFDYTYTGWDKARPITLKATGLGKALKLYESAKKELISRSKSKISQGETPTDVDDLNFVKNYYLPAKKAFDDVETARKEAIIACGTKHTDAKKYLSGAKEDAELKILTAAVNTKFDELIVKCFTEKHRMSKKLSKRVKEAESDISDYTTKAEKYNKAIDNILGAKKAIKEINEQLKKKAIPEKDAQEKIEKETLMIEKFTPLASQLGKELVNERKKLSEHYFALGENGPNAAGLWFQPCESDFAAVKAGCAEDKAGDLESLPALKGMAEVKTIRAKLSEQIESATRGPDSTAAKLARTMELAKLPG